MNDAQQAEHMLREFLRARKHTPWIAAWFEQMSEDTGCWQGPRSCVARLGGLGVWDTRSVWEKTLEENYPHPVNPPRPVGTP